MKIGVYVGSFDPIHNGHIAIINHLLNKYLDKIIIIPTGNYWDKNNLISIKHRINMIKILEIDNLIVNDKLNDLEYTYLILDELKKEYDNLYLIIGADNVIRFNEWKEYKKILENNILVIPRSNIDISPYINDKFILVEDFYNVDISSSEIRDNIKNGNSKVLKYVPKKVERYIVDNNLYR